MRHACHPCGNRLLIFSATVAALSVLQTGQVAAKQDDSMASALLQSGYRAVSLHRQSEGGLSVSVKVNGRPTQLAVCTGAPISAINRISAQRFGIREEKSDLQISGAFGVLDQRLGIAPRNTVELVNIVQPDVTFAVYNEPLLAADSKGASLVTLAHLNCRAWPRSWIAETPECIFVPVGPMGRPARASVNCWPGAASPAFRCKLTRDITSKPLAV